MSKKLLRPVRLNSGPKVDTHKFGAMIAAMGQVVVFSTWETFAFFLPQTLLKCADSFTKRCERMNF